jgi:soluble lytic murein transglycosylase-like protein
MKRYPIIVMVLLCALSWAIVAALVLAIHSAAAQPVASLQYRAQITREAQFRFGIPAPVPAIAAQIMQESAFNPLARSRVGASGLMQFMPTTATWAAQASHTGPAETFNPQWSIRMGVWYDRWLYERIRAETECDRWMFALSSYNGGLGYVYKRQKLSTAPGSWPTTGMLNPGITPANQVENQSYGPRILLKHQPQFASWGRTTCLE